MMRLLRLADLQFLLNDRGRLVDARAIQVKDERHRRQEREHAVPNPRRPLAKIRGGRSGIVRIGTAIAHESQAVGGVGDSTA